MALSTPMNAFRILLDVRMQCSFRQAGAVMLAAPFLNLRAATDGFLCLPAEGAPGFLWLCTHTCDAAGSSLDNRLSADNGQDQLAGIAGAVQHAVDGGGRLVG